MDYLAQTLCKGRSLVLPQLDVLVFVQAIGGLPFLNGEGGGVEGEGCGWKDRGLYRVEQEKRRKKEGKETGLLCKINGKNVI